MRVTNIVKPNSNDTMNLYKIAFTNRFKKLLVNPYILDKRLLPIDNNLSSANHKEYKDIIKEIKSSLEA